MARTEINDDSIEIGLNNPIPFYHDPDGPIIIHNNGESSFYTYLSRPIKFDALSKNLATHCLNGAALCSITGTAPQITVFAIQAATLIPSNPLLCGIFGSNKPDLKHQDQVASQSGPKLLCTIKPSPCPIERPTLCGITGSFGPMVKSAIGTGGLLS